MKKSSLLGEESEAALSARDPEERDVEDLVADEEAGREDDIDAIEGEDDLTDFDHAEAIRLGRA